MNLTHSDDGTNWLVSSALLLKLLQGNVFNCVSLFVCPRWEGGSHVTSSHDALNLTVQVPSAQGLAPSVQGPALSVQLPPPSVGKRAILILPECFLAHYDFYTEIS